MRGVIAFVLALAGAVPCHSADAIFRHKDTKVNQEFEQIYQEIRGLARVPSRTEAQLKAQVPTRAGLLFYCSDCSVDGVVVSTGTTTGAFGRISARTTTID